MLSDMLSIFILNL